MARAYGSSASLLLKRETAYGQKPAGNFYKMPFTSCNLGSEQGLIDDPVLGFGRDPAQPLRDVINVDGDITVPVDPRYLGLWLTGLFGEPETETVKAEGYIAFAANPSNGDTITINGTAFTFVSGMPAGNQIEIKSTVMQTIDEAVSVLNASVVGTVDDATYSRPTGTQRLKIVHDTTGATGNAFTLAASAAGVSAPTLCGGGILHMFESGAESLPSYSIEVGLPQIPAFFLNTGVVVNSIGFDFQRSGAATATVNVIAQGETRFGATQGGTPQQLTFNRTSQFQGEIRHGGEKIGNLTGGTVTYTNNLERIETIRDDGKIDGADPTIAALTGSITVRFADTTLIDLASNGTPIDLEFVYTLAPGLSLTVTAHEVYLPKPKPPINGAGGIETSFDFQAAKNEAAGCMVTVKLLNDLDGTQYA